MKTGKFWEFTKNEQQRLINKLNRLYQKVAGINPRYALKIAGAAVCFAFISTGAKAQTPTFRVWETNNPFDISSVHGNSNFTPRDAAFADVDGDGDDDAFVFITDCYEVAFFENVSGVFTENSSNNPFLCGSYNQGIGYSIDIADFDGDGDLDAIITHPSGYVSHFELVNNDYFYQYSSSPINSYSGGSGIYTNGRQAKFSDVDGDGDLDIVATYCGNYYLSSYLQQSDGSFSKAPWGYPACSSIPGSNSNTNINLKDMDGDGDDDLFVFNPTPSGLGSPGALTDATSNILYYENTSGSGNFILNSNVPLPVGDMPSSEIPILVDLDGDGDTDIFLPGLTSNSFENLTDSAPTVPVSPFIAFILFAASGFGILRRNRKKKKE